MGHEKTFGWYVALAAAAVVVAIVIYMLTKDKISTAVVLLGALSLGVLAGRQPGPQTYQLDENGVTIGNRHYAYTMFKAFSVNPEGGISSVVFTPLKRFAPLTTIYYAPEDEEKILDQLSSQLPFEHRKPDAVDSMMRRIRF